MIKNHDSKNIETKKIIAYLKSVKSKIINEKKKSKYWINQNKIKKIKKNRFEKENFHNIMITKIIDQFQLYLKEERQNIVNKIEQNETIIQNVQNDIDSNNSMLMRSKGNVVTETNDIELNVEKIKLNFFEKKNVQKNRKIIINKNEDNYDKNQFVNFLNDNSIDEW